MDLLSLARVVVALLVCGVLAVLALRALGFRVEVRFRQVRRRRRPIEPDEHTQFL